MVIYMKIVSTKEKRENIMETKNKRGISLIVLVITKIVMIILATAIILSLNNSGIIGKANKAKNDSDTATLKEYVNTLKLDWEFMTAEGKTAAGSFSEYATAKLEEKGYNRMVTEDGIILTEEATAAVKAGIEIGDEVTGYNAYLVSQEIETEYYKNVFNPYMDEADKHVSNKTDFVWRYAGVDKNGKMTIVPDMTADSPEITLYCDPEAIGNLGELNDACKTLYSTEKGEATSIDREDVLRILGYSGYKYGYITVESQEVFTPTALTVGEIIKSTNYLNTPTGENTWEALSKYKSEWLNLNSGNYSFEEGRRNDMLFSDDNRNYWIATTVSWVQGSKALWGCFETISSPGGLWPVAFFDSNTGLSVFDTYDGPRRLRPIVSLNSDVILTPNADDTWSIN